MDGPAGQWGHVVDVGLPIVDHATLYWAARDHAQLTVPYRCLVIFYLKCAAYKST